MILFVLSFIAGILTILAPCVLPLLPVIVGSSLSGTASRKKAFVVTGSLGISVIIFTLLLKASTVFITVPQSVWEYISGVIIIFFGLVTIFPSLWDKLSFTSFINRKSNEMLAVGYQKKNFLGDIIIGAALGPVFSSCSPTYFLILATVLPAQPLIGVFDLLAYAVGMCGALLIVAFVGQKILERLEIASDPNGWFKRSLGILFLIVGVAIFTGTDQRVEAWLLSSNNYDITKVEQYLLKYNASSEQQDITKSISPQATSTLDTSASTTSENNIDAASRIARKSLKYPKAPEIKDPSGFINTNGKPITIGQFKGKKVVLLDIWTYSCINCQRTLPYIRAWYDKYSDQGLEIIGIHTPEFSFEKVLSNVQDATNRLGLKYPVVLDNNYATWNAFGNQYWPRKYLIDIDGYIVYDHIGEGNYDETEQAIQAALKERDQVLGTSSASLSGISQPKDSIDVSMGGVQSPEVYFGSGRNEYLTNGQQFKTGTQALTIPGDPSSFFRNELYLGGTWDFQKEFATNNGPAKIVFKYSAKNVYMVASSDQGATVKILRDGKLYGSVTIQGSQLYPLIQDDSYGEHTLELDIDNGSIHAFTFTFG